MRILAFLLAGALVSCAGEPRPAPDACQSCHRPEEAPTGVHAALSCAACHLGQPDQATAERAHVDLEREPGALDTVDRTCGSAGCHAEQAARVKDSLMATNLGIVAVDRWAMGELPLPEGQQTMQEVLADPQPGPAEDHLRQLCGGCHLHSRKDNRDDAIVGIGSGCSACHTASRPGRWERHPGIDLVVPDDRCLGCHSRSGRISLSYQGLAEVRGVDCDAPTSLHDGRPACRGPADLHHEAGLSCTDCHLHTELMGDGTRWGHEAQATELRCESCHGPGAPETRWAQVEDPVSRRLLRQHGQQRPPDEAVRLGSRGTPLWNLRPQGSGWSLQPKDGGPALAVTPTPADATHLLAGHGPLSCATCHSRVVPSCPDCHTRYEPQGQAWDFGRGAETPGRWVEEAAHMGTGRPALGRQADGSVATFIPGMIWQLDARQAGGPTLTARRFAAIAPHRSTRPALGCPECHQDPVAVGLGEGRLDLATLRFQPLRPSADDPSLAADGWVGLLPAAAGEGTRPGQRSFDAREQVEILRVGLCLPCHPSAEDAVYADFPAALARLSRGGARCRVDLPAWARP